MADDEGGAGVEDSCACCRLKPSDTQVIVFVFVFCIVLSLSYTNQITAEWNLLIPRSTQHQLLVTTNGMQIAIVCVPYMSCHIDQNILTNKIFLNFTRQTIACHTARDHIPKHAVLKFDDFNFACDLDLSTFNRARLAGRLPQRILNCEISQKRVLCTKFQMSSSTLNISTETHSFTLKEAIIKLSKKVRVKVKLMLRWQSSSANHT